MPTAIVLTTCSAATKVRTRPSTSRSRKGRPSPESSSGGSPGSLQNYLRFAETVNGRSAMQGVAWAAIEAMSHGAHQFESLDAVVVTGLVAAGTAVTYSDDESLSWGPFTPEAEIQNGRGAMLAMAGWLVARSQGLV